MYKFSCQYRGKRTENTIENLTILILDYKGLKS